MKEQSNEMELKAYKLLAEIRGSMLSTIQHEARNKVEYIKSSPDAPLEFLSFIANPAKWDYCGLLKKEDKRVLEVLEYLLDPTKENISPYKEWIPMEH